MASLKGKVALVTGASDGIGKEISLALAGKGANVVLVARRKELLEQIAADIKGRGGNALPFAADITLQADRQRAVDATVKAYGRIDYLVNNAGIFDEKPLEKVSAEEIDRMLDLNLRAPLQLTRLALSYLLKSKGVVLNVSSLSSINAYANEEVYVTTKAGINGFTQSLRNSYGKQGLAVYALLPGSVDTPLIRKYLEAHRVENEKWLKMPLEEYYTKILTPADVAAKGIEMLEKRPAEPKNGLVIMKSYEF